MQWKNWGIKGSAALILTAAMVGCIPVHPVTPAPGDTTATEATAEPASAPNAAAYNDPFAYCAATGTINQPDDRYTGEEVPDTIAEGIRSAFDAEDVDLEVYRRGTVWRCVDGKVYACNVGANIPCLAKADLSREPSQPIIDYCKEIPTSDFIPAAVTGRSTIYSWGCKDSEPIIVEQYTEVDQQGVLEFAWHELTPPQ
jgi:hypothetical protein